MNWYRFSIKREHSSRIETVHILAENSVLAVNSLPPNVSWNFRSAMTLEDARDILSEYERVVERSHVFSDAEVRYCHNNKVVFEGYIGYPVEKSNITVNGREFTGRDAYLVMGGLR